MKAPQGQDPLSYHFLTVRALPLSLEFPVFPIPAVMRFLHLWAHRHRQKEGSRIQELLGLTLNLSPSSLCTISSSSFAVLLQNWEKALIHHSLSLACQKNQAEALHQHHFPLQPREREDCQSKC